MYCHACPSPPVECCTQAEIVDSCQSGAASAAGENVVVSPSTRVCIQARKKERIAACHCAEFSQFATVDPVHHGVARPFEASSF